MSDPAILSKDNLPLSELKRIDRVCHEFETDWQPLKTTAIPVTINEFSGLSRAALLSELLLIDIDCRLRAGCDVAIQEYSKILPHDSSTIRWAILKSEYHLQHGQVLQHIDGFRVIERIATSRLSMIFKAKDNSTDEVVAIKVLSPDLMENPSALAQFSDEVQAACKVKHQNVVSARSTGNVDGLQYLVMEFVRGATLKEIVERIGPLSPAHACEVIYQAALGLSSIHENGIIHRDIKPSNLILTSDAIVKVLDLGLARLRTTSPAPIGMKVVGTLEFMAPEQLENPGMADERSDVFSLGCTFFYLLKGQSPLKTGDTDPMREDENFVTVSAACSDLPNPVKSLALRLLRFESSSRIQSSLEVANALLPLREHADLREIFERFTHEANPTAS